MKNKINTEQERENLTKDILPAINEFFDVEPSTGYVDTLTGMITNYPKDGPEFTTICNIVNLISKLEGPRVLSATLNRIDEADDLVKTYQSYMGDNTNNPNK